MRRASAPPRLAALALAAALIATLSGCGKKGSLEPPPGEPSVFPRTYPHEAAPPAQRQQAPQPPPDEAPPDSLLIPQPSVPRAPLP